jgi:hypothetical protein
MTLAAVARSDGFEVFTHPQRIKEITGSAQAKETVTNVA